MYVKLDEQHEFCLYQLSQMVIAEFFSISVKTAHRKTFTVNSSSHVHYKIIYKKSAWGVYVIFRLYSRSYILQYEYKIIAVCTAKDGEGDTCFPFRVIIERHIGKLTFLAFDQTWQNEDVEI